MEKKEYIYLSSLCGSILDMYNKYDGSLTEQVAKRDNHPELIASNIAGVQPPSTLSIVQRKCTRFK